MIGRRRRARGGRGPAGSCRPAGCGRGRGGRCAGGARAGWCAAGRGCRRGARRRGRCRSAALVTVSLTRLARPASSTGSPPASMAAAASRSSPSLSSTWAVDAAERLLEAGQRGQRGAEVRRHPLVEVAAQPVPGGAGDAVVDRPDEDAVPRRERRLRRGQPQLAGRHDVDGVLQRDRGVLEHDVVAAGRPHAERVPRLHDPAARRPGLDEEAADERVGVVAAGPHQHPAQHRDARCSRSCGR